MCVCVFYLIKFSYSWVGPLVRSDAHSGVTSDAHSSLGMGHTHTLGSNVVCLLYSRVVRDHMHVLVWE